MTVEIILLAGLVLMLIPFFAAWVRSHNQGHLYRYKSCVIQEEEVAMTILAHNAEGATIRLDQRGLLLVMALIQEGRESFGCNTAQGRALDDLFSTANVLVEDARRNNQTPTLIRPNIRLVATPEPAALKAASNS